MLEVANTLVNKLSMKIVRSSGASTDTDVGDVVLSLLYRQICAATDAVIDWRAFSQGGTITAANARIYGVAAVACTQSDRAPMDSKTTIQDLKDAVRDMCQYRGWGGEKAIQNPQKMAMAMAMTIELGELMEHFAWLDNTQLEDLVAGNMPGRRAHIAEELADILIYAIQLARGLDRKR